MWGRRASSTGAATNGATVTVLESFGPPHARTNPYIRQLAASFPPSVRLLHFSWRRAVFGRYDVFHVHWPEVLVRGRSPVRGAVRSGLYLLVLAQLRLRGRALVRTLHNEAPHEPVTRAQAWVLGCGDRRTTLWIALSEHARPPSPAPVVVAPLGDCRELADRADGAAGVDGDRPPVPGRLLHFGHVRRYKGVDALLDAFRQLDDGGVSLRIVGETRDAATRAAVARAAAADARITAVDAFVPDEQLLGEVLDSELVVLPFTRMTNSSSLLLALSLDRPVLVPRTGLTAALAAEVGPGWVHTYEGALDAAALARALAAVRAARAGGDLAPPDLSARAWPAIGARHAEAFRRARDLARGRPSATS
jgi:beta-1,4-mannosyltransferase